MKALVLKGAMDFSYEEQPDTPYSSRLPQALVRPARQARQVPQGIQGIRQTRSPPGGLG